MERYCTVCRKEGVFLTYISNYIFKSSSVAMRERAIERERFYRERNKEERKLMTKETKSPRKGICEGICEDGHMGQPPRGPWENPKNT